MQIIKEIISAFSSASSNTNQYSAQDKFLAHQNIFQALFICLNDLEIDGNIESNSIAQMQDGVILDVAKKDIVPAFFEKEIMSIESKEAAINTHSPQFYVEAALAHFAGTAEYSERLLQGDDGALGEVSDSVLFQVNEELADVNDQLHSKFCSYMGYSEAEMDYDKIVRAVEFADDNNMINGKSLENWFPVAYANMPQDKSNNSFAPKGP